MEDSGNKAEKFSSVNSFSSHHDQADADEGKSSKPQNHSSLTCLSFAGEDEQNEVADTSFRTALLFYSSVEGQREKFCEIEEEEAGLLRKNHSHKHENTVTQRKGEASPQNDLRININKMIKTVRSPLSSEYCCIYKVTPVLREVNEEAYTPQVVSIGPLHHKNEKLKGMQEVKIRYLEQFLLRAAKTAMLKDLPSWADQKAFLNSKDVDTEKLKDFSCIDKFLEILKSSEENIRKSYSEDLNHLTSNDLLKIILVDAAFIIEFFLRCYSDFEGDTILPSCFAMIYIRRDLGLLENQVPFFVLEDLYGAAFGSYPHIYPTFLVITLKCFEVYDDQKWPIKGKILHFTDLLRTFHLPIPKHEDNSSNAGALEENYSDSILRIFTDFLRYWGLLSRSGRKNEDQKEPSCDLEYKELDEHLKSATQLHAAGVVFTVSSSKCLLDINFSIPKLEMPCLSLSGGTEVVFRNVMALEQYHYLDETLICDYITVMDYLIDTREDVQLLVEKKIIKNWLGSNEEAASLFNSLRRRIVGGDINGRLYCLIKELNAYYAKPWNSWKATFWRQYFSTPWRSASTIAAIILLVLTLAQTILAVVPMYRGGRQ